MYYDIRNVGYEYMAAEDCLKKGILEDALAHYKNAIDNYDNCDNLQAMPSFDEPYTESGPDYVVQYPSVDDMVNKSYSMVNKINRKLRKLQKKEDKSK